MNRWTTCVVYMLVDAKPVDRDFYKTDMIFENLFKILAIKNTGPY